MYVYCMYMYSPIRNRKENGTNILRTHQSSMYKGNLLDSRNASMSSLGEINDHDLKVLERLCVISFYRTCMVKQS